MTDVQTRPAPRAARGQHHLPALLALTLSVFLVTVNVTVVVVALPAIARDLDAAPDQAAWVIDAYNVVGASLLLSAGFFADRFGRKRMLCTGYVFFVLGALLCAVAPSVGWLIGFRALQAVGGTALTPTSLSIVANLYPDPRERARAIGIWGVSSGLGTGLGPLIGGGLTDQFGWRSVFLANALVGVVALGVVIRVVPRSRSPHPRRLDVPGQVVVALLLATLTYALIEAPRYGWSSPRILGLLVLDVVLVALFVRIELRTEEPLVDLHFFEDRQFAGAICITVAAFFTFSGFIYFNALYLQQVRGYSALAAGLLTLPAAVPTIIGGPLAGFLVATRGPRGVLIAGTLTMAAGVAALALLEVHVAIAWLLASYLVLGFGYAVINAPISTVAVASMPREQAGVAAAVASSARNVGLVFGIAVLGSVVSVRAPASDAPPAVARAFGDAFTSSLHHAYLLACLVALGAALVALLTLRPTPPAHRTSGVP